MMKIYKLISNIKEFSFFLYDHKGNSNRELSISRDSITWKWNYPSKYNIATFELRAGDNKKKNYNFDISTFESPFIIISEKAWLDLKDILEPRGVLLEINTQSKRKKFYGYYPTNSITIKSLNKELSTFTEYPNGIIVRDLVLNEKYLSDDYLFSIENTSLILVTEKFKERVEKAGLLGFDFSEENNVVVS